MKNGSVHTLRRVGDMVEKIPFIKANKNIPELVHAIQLHAKYLGDYFVETVLEPHHQYGYILKQKYIHGRVYTYEDFRKGLLQEQCYEIIQRGKEMEKKESIYFDVFGFDGIIHYEFNRLSPTKKALLKNFLQIQYWIGVKHFCYTHEGEKLILPLQNTLEVLKNPVLAFSNILIDERQEKLYVIDFSGSLENPGRAKLKRITDSIINQL